MSEAFDDQAVSEVPAGDPAEGDPATLGSSRKGSSDNSPVELGISCAPRGELAAAQLVTAAAQIGDVAERHYLKLKGPPSLSAKAAKHNVEDATRVALNRPLLSDDRS